MKGVSYILDRTHLRKTYSNGNHEGIADTHGRQAPISSRFLTWMEGVGIPDGKEDSQGGQKCKESSQFQ